MEILADTNVLLRRVHRLDRQYRVTRVALDRLDRAGHRICVTSQNLVELWTAGTRPTSVNGLGFEIAAADRVLRRVEANVERLPDTDDVYAEWRRLVVTYSVSGKPVYDARIIAAMNVHRITHILTFDTSGFARYPGITILDPLVVAESLPQE